MANKITSKKDDSKVPTQPTESGSSYQNQSSDYDFIKNFVTLVTEYSNNLKTLRDEIDRNKSSQRELEKNNEKYTIDIDLLKKNIDALSTKTQDSIDDLSNKETKLIETLGIFFALFAFISISVQIYSRVINLFSAAIFTFLIFCLLTMIIVIFDLLIYKKFKYIVVYCFIIFFLLVLTIINLTYLKNITLNPVENTKEFNDAVEKTLKNDYYNKSDIDLKLNPLLKDSDLKN